MAEYYSAELSQKVKRGMNENRQKGLYTGGYVVFGYRAEKKKIVVHEEESKVVQYIFNECAAGKPVIHIYNELKEKGIKHRNKPFARNTLYQLLANEKIFRHTKIWRPSF